MSIPDRLKSRKLWLTISAVIALVVNEQYTEALGAVIAYLFVQGGEDIVVKREQARMPKVEYGDFEASDDVDTGNVVSGSDLE